MSAAHVHQGHVDGASLNRSAVVATVHCLAGCAVGETLGLVVATALEIGRAHV